MNTQKQVVITGGAGRIGTIIFEDLGRDFSFTRLDNDFEKRKEAVLLDVASQYSGLVKVLKDKDAVIHLAWNAKEENWKNGKVWPVNKLMAENVFRAAVEAGVPRVIMVSSIHADNFSAWQGPGLMSAGRIPVPNNLYGASKVYIEALGRYYAAGHGLEVVCMRFGGVSPDDMMRSEDGYERIWLSRRDCASAIKTYLDPERLGIGFCVFYAVSDNAAKIHDWSNFRGWVPLDDSSKIAK